MNNISNIKKSNRIKTDRIKNRNIRTIISDNLNEIDENTEMLNDAIIMIKKYTKTKITKYLLQ
jgi:hypothetical protein